MGIFNKLFGTHSERELKRIEPVVKDAMAYKEVIEKLSDDELRAKTKEFREALAGGENIDDLIPEAYAVVREASKRVTGMEHFKVQLTGGVILHQGRVAEMKTGEGKAVAVDTKIPTPNGWVRAGDIKLGDTVFDEMGYATTITGVYPQGLKDTYELKLKDGRTIKCNSEHLWNVKLNRATGKYKSRSKQTLTTQELIETGVKASRGYTFSLPMCDCVQYEEKDLPVDPYVLGAFLGDGCKSKSGALLFSSADEEIVNSIANILKVAPHKLSGNNYNWDFYTGNKIKGSRNERLYASHIANDKEIISLMTDTYCTDKYIPDIYKTASEEQRYALLQGMMDTDGNIYAGSEEDKTKRYTMQYATSSERLRDDFMEVIYSLGLTCSTRIRTIEDGKLKNAKHDQYIIYINVPNEIKYKFFRLEKKKSIALECKEYHEKAEDYNYISIVDIKKLEEQTEQVCFTVSNLNHLFLVGNYVVTHNTITIELPTYLNALTGESVYVVTVNDYLAQRDAETVRPVHEFLGLTVGCVTSGMSIEEKKKQYACDITYVTNSELGFDYLRDNMAVSEDKQVLRGLHYCIIDEVDSVLIDEARTPLIISMQGDGNTKIYEICDKVAKVLKQGEVVKLNKIDYVLGEVPDESGDFVYDERDKNIHLTEDGVRKVERFFGIKNLADEENSTLAHAVNTALKANYMFTKDKDYIVQDDKVMIVDEHTGRVMDGRRYSDGLHQAIEAKEGVKINKESKTQATITYQNFFNKFEKKCGLTGTALTEEQEFRDIYGMDVVEVPTNLPVKRKDLEDVVYKTQKEKYKAVIDDIIQAHEKGQPVLVGTATVDVSEIIDKMLSEKGIEHTVLNAKYHKQEAEIISHAGEKGAVTVATNMAGRGTDIKLADGVKELGGLKVIGTERHESRRIDNQLRGRSGRQGDPGESIFYISLEDNLMRVFGSEKMIDMFTALDIPEGAPIQHKMLTKAIETAQKRIEFNNFGIRKRLIEYDDVINKQREIVYADREKILHGDNMQETIYKMIEHVLRRTVEYDLVSDDCREDWDLATLSGNIHRIFEVKLDKIDVNSMTIEDIINALYDKIIDKYEANVNTMDNPEQFRSIERQVFLRKLDEKWQNHIDDMDELKQYIGLQAYAQKDPVLEYKTQGFDMFDNMVEDVKTEVVRILCHIKVTKQAPENEAKAVDDDTKQKAEKFKQFVMTKKQMKAKAKTIEDVDKQEIKEDETSEDVNKQGHDEAKTDNADVVTANK